MEPGRVDCEFTSPNGVRYIGFETFVGAIIADASVSPDVALPYGVRVGDPRDVVQGKLSTTVRWTESEDAILSVDEFEGAQGFTYSLYFDFENEQLVEVKYYTQYF